MGILCWKLTLTTWADNATFPKSHKKEHVTQEELDIRIIRIFRIAAQGLQISEIWKYKIIWLIVYGLQLLPSYDLSHMTRGYVLKVKKHMNGSTALKRPQSIKISLYL